MCYHRDTFLFFIKTQVLCGIGKVILDKRTDAAVTPPPPSPTPAAPPAAPSSQASPSRRAGPYSGALPACCLCRGDVDHPPLAGTLPGAPSRPVAPPSCRQRPPGPITGRPRPVPALPLPMEFECFRAIQSRGQGTWRCALVAKVARSGWRVASRRDQSARSGAPLLGRAQTAAGAAAALNCGGERVLSWRSAALRWSPPALRGCGSRGSQPASQPASQWAAGVWAAAAEPRSAFDSEWAIERASERSGGRGLRAAVRLGAARSGGVRQPEWAGAPRYAARLAVSSDDALIERVSAVSGALPRLSPGAGVRAAPAFGAVRPREGGPAGGKAGEPLPQPSQGQARWDSWHPRPHSPGGGGLCPSVVDP